MNRAGLQCANSLLDTLQTSFPANHACTKSLNIYIVFLTKLKQSVHGASFEVHLIFSLLKSVINFPLRIIYTIVDFNLNKRIDRSYHKINKLLVVVFR